MCNGLKGKCFSVNCKISHVKCEIKKNVKILSVDVVWVWTENLFVQMLKRMGVNVKSTNSCKNYYSSIWDEC